MPSLPDPDPVELLDGGALSTDETISRGSFLSGGLGGALGAMVVVGLVLALLAAFVLDAETVPDRSVSPEDVAAPPSESGDASVGSGAALPPNPGAQRRAINHRLDELDGVLLVAMASPRGITLWDLTGGQRSIEDLPERPAGPGLVAVEDRLVYVGSTSAWSVTADGRSRAIGRADQVTAAGTSGAVWLGLLADEETTVTYFDWSEVDEQGNELRSTRRGMPMEFQSPDLVWGFNSSLFRLTDDTDRPWRLVDYGIPVAVGQNDLIVKACDPDCHRVWYDTATGEDLGPLLADVSTAYNGQGGWLSPDGRFLAHQRGSTGPVKILSLGLGGEATVDCRSARDVVWSTVGFVACETSAGISIVDMESGGSITLLPPADLFGFTLWLTEMP